MQRLFCATRCPSRVQKCLRLGCLLAPALFVLSLPSAFAQSDVSTEPPSPPLTEVSGVVVEAGTGAPVARAVVSCAAVQQPIVFTGLDGRYQIKCSPHPHSLRVARPGFLEITVPEMVLGAMADPAQWKDRLKQIRLVRAGSITGTVMNDLDEPVPQAAVFAQAPKIADGFEVQDVYVSGFSDDQGAFRLASLPPGTYTLSVKRRVGELTTGRRIPPVIRRVLVSASGASAASLRVESGQEIPVHFKMRAVPAYSISGVIKGLPAGAIASVNVESDDAPDGGGGTLAGTGGDVPFVLAGLPRGHYVIRLRSDDNGLSASARVDLAGANVGDVELRAEPVPAISIEVVPSTNGGISPSEFRLYAAEPVPAAPWRQSFAPAPVENRPGGYEFRAVPPGRYRLTAYRGIAGRVQSARSGSSDILRDGLMVGDGAASDPIRIELAQGTGEVLARCSGGNAEMALLFEVAHPERPPQISVTTRDGLRVFPGLPMDQYALVCLAKRDDVAYNEPGAYEKLKSWLALVTLSGSESVKVEVKKFVKVAEP